MPLKKKIGKMSNAEKQRLYRERRHMIGVRNLKLAVFKTLKKYRIVRSSLNNYLGLRRGFRQTAGLKEKLNLRKKTVEAFFGRDDNSRATSGKKETITPKMEKRQKRFLTSSIKDFHQKYVAEGNEGTYESFRNYRPFHIKNPTAKERESCLCKLHTNLKIKAQKLKLLKICSEDKLSKLAAAIVCDTKK